MVRWIVALLVAASCLTAGRAQADALVYEEYFESFDGVRLHAYVSRPDTAEDVPVILTVTPYAGWAGNVLGPDPLNMDAPGASSVVDRGHARAVVELRGTGGSGGCYDLWGPKEIGDAKAAVEHYADAEWSSGKVGMTGSSYDGFTQIAAMSAHARGLAVVIAGAPPVGYHNLWMNRVRETGGGHGFSALYLAGDLYPAGAFAPIEQNVNQLNFGPHPNPACHAEPFGGPLLNDDRSSSFWAARELAVGAYGSEVPTVWRQGFSDWQVRPNGFMDIFPTLRGPKLGLFGPWDHGAPSNPDAAADRTFGAISNAWLDHYLKGVGPAPQTGAMVQIWDDAGTWRDEADWPPADAAPRSFQVKPGTYLDVGGNNGETGYPDAFGMIPVDKPEPLPTGTGTWTFTPPLDAPVHISGLPRVSAEVTTLVPGVHLVALLYDVDPDGNARLVSRGVYKVPSSGTISFDLYPQDWRFDAGHRIGLLLSGGDDIFFEPPTSATPVLVDGGTYTLPVIGDRTDTYTEGPFRPKRRHAPVVVDQATIAANTVP